MDEALLRDGYSPLTAPPSEVTLKRPANVESQTDRNSPVVPEMSLTGRPENDEERRVVTLQHQENKTMNISIPTIYLFRPEPYIPYVCQYLHKLYKHE